MLLPGLLPPLGLVVKKWAKFPIFVGQVLVPVVVWSTIIKGSVSTRFFAAIFSIFAAVHSANVPQYTFLLIPP